MSSHEPQTSDKSSESLHINRPYGNRPMSPSKQPYGDMARPPTPYRVASHGLTSTRGTYDAYDDGTELRELPPTKYAESDTCKLLEPRERRSSTASIASSSSTLVRQSQPVRWLNSIGRGVEYIFNLPGVRHFIWPLVWLDQAINRSMMKTRFHGWRMGILLGCAMSTVVLVANITILVIGARRGRGFENGFAVPMTGMADSMSWWSSAFHLLINALSTLLLAASNYTMQVLSSPTRKDIDEAHAKKEHLDIGVLSVRNLSRIPRRRLLLFILMGLSSIPIHLFYNSAVFYIGANNQYVIRVTQVDSELYNEVKGLSKMPSSNGTSYTAVKGTEWVRMYDNELVSYGTLILAVDEYRTFIENKTFTGYPDRWPDVPTEDANAWAFGNETYNLAAPLTLRPATKVLDLFNDDAATRAWVDFTYAYGRSTSNTSTDTLPRFAHITHAFAKNLDTASRIQMSLTFLIIVIVCNSIKLLTMLWVVMVERKDYLVTLGDGAASFLERPDPTTERMCILSKPEITSEVADMTLTSKHDDQLSRLMSHSKKRWSKQYSTYSNALNRDREIGSYFIFIVIGVLFALLMTALVFLGKASTNWGTKSDTTFREADSSAQQTLLNAWIANAPQLVLSFCYLAINSECTAMAGAAEWNSFASSHKGLRVTRPVGQQRDTYFLQLPYRWSLPLTIASGGLHWLLSQSIFLVRIDDYGLTGELNAFNSKSACGFSPTSWITLTVCFLLLVGTVGLVGRKKIKVKIPFAASCSLVISAACHTMADDADADAHLRPVRWGVVERRMYDGEMHCSFSSRNVTKPKAGATYL